MHKIFYATYKILTSTKGQNLIVSQLMGVIMAIVLKADFTAWSIFAGAMFTMWGIGHQNDTHHIVDVNKKVGDE